MDKGRISGGFVPLRHSVLDTPAWRAMSHGAQALYVALKRRHSFKSDNNGWIFLSHRKAKEELHSHHRQIARWFRELQFYGFIVMQSAGSLGVDGKGKAPHWRLTELPFKGEHETRDFIQWKGNRFDPKAKTESRALKAARGVREKQHTGGVEKQHAQERKRALKAAHIATAPKVEKQHISRITTPSRFQMNLFDTAEEGGGAALRLTEPSPKE